MAHDSALIATIAIGLSAAFVVGFGARRLGLPPIVGYLLAGVLIGPFTPGLIADAEIATELAEIGVILLMFGVGLHFSVRDLLAVRRVAIPGAIVQSTVSTLLGIALALALGWGLAAGIVLGLAVSVASTVVLLRALGQRGALESVHGRVAVGWLIVEDIFTVLVLVLLPTLPLLLGTEAGDLGSSLGALGAAVGKAAILALLVFLIGTRAVPWVLFQVARDGSREMFTLSVLAVALGIAFASYAVFGVSLALGAFLAGAIVGETDLSHRVAADALPLRDAFSVLFFVSVGMLLDPAVLIANPLTVLGVVLLVVIGKSIAAVAIVAALGYPLRTGLTVGAGLAQIGEFSFILATAGVAERLLPIEAFQLVVAGALVTITLNPLMFALVDPLDAWIRRHPRLRELLDRGAADLATRGPRREPLRGHAIVVGYGRIGRTVARALEGRNFPYLVLEEDRRAVENLRARGVEALYGDVTDDGLLEHAGVAAARVLVLTTADPPGTAFAAKHARAANPRIEVVARVESGEEASRLRNIGHVQAVEGEREVGVQLARYTLRRFGVAANEVEIIAQGLRRRSDAAASA
jgi:CPA2 family monovalent cation:H+ antiporter-2